MEEFFENLCRIHRLLIEKNLQAYGAGKEESKDIVSDAILWLWKDFSSNGYDPDRKDEYMKLLYTVSKRRWWDVTRSSRFKNLRLDRTDSGYEGIENQAEMTDWDVNAAQKFIRKVFLAWNERKGKLLYMRYFLGATVEDLAEDFNYSSANAARVTCCGARKDFLSWIAEKPELEARFRDALEFFEENTGFENTQEEDSQDEDPQDIEPLA